MTSASASDASRSGYMAAQGTGSAVASSSSSSPPRELPSRDDVAAQWLFNEDDLKDTPTVLNGILSPAEERKARRRGVGLIYKVAERSQLHSHVLHTAALFFQRFFFRQNMRPPGYPTHYAGQCTYVYQDIALAALYLASKVEEGYRKLDDIVAIACEVEPGRVGSGLEEGESEEAVLRNGILAGEEIILATLCFDLVVEHPQKQLIIACRRLGVEIELLRCAYANMHDSFRDPICTFFEAPVLAAGVFALACEDAEVDPYTYTAEAGDDRNQAGTLSWLDTFDVSEDEVDACLTALQLVRSSLQITESRLTASTTGTPRTDPATPYHPSAPASSGHRTPLAVPVCATVTIPQQPNQPPPILPLPPLERVAAAETVNGGSGGSRPSTRHGASSLFVPLSRDGASSGVNHTFSHIGEEAGTSIRQQELPSPQMQGTTGAPAISYSAASDKGISAVDQETYVPLSPTLEEEEEEEVVVAAATRDGHGESIGEGSNGLETSTGADRQASLPTSQSQGYVPLSPPTFPDDEEERRTAVKAGEATMQEKEEVNGNKVRGDETVGTEFDVGRSAMMDREEGEIEARYM